MKDIPQPVPDPYALGDEVQIYLDPADPDAHTHGTVCEVVDVLADDSRFRPETGIPVLSEPIRPSRTE